MNKLLYMHFRYQLVYTSFNSGIQKQMGVRHSDSWLLSFAVWPLKFLCWTAIKFLGLNWADLSIGYTSRGDL